MHRKRTHAETLCTRAAARPGLRVSRDWRAGCRCRGFREVNSGRILSLSLSPELSPSPHTAAAAHQRSLGMWREGQREREKKKAHTTRESLGFYFSPMAPPPRPLPTPPRSVHRPRPRGLFSPPNRLLLLMLLLLCLGRVHVRALESRERALESFGRRARVGGIEVAGGLGVCRGDLLSVCFDEKKRRRESYSGRGELSFCLGVVIREDEWWWCGGGVVFDLGFRRGVRVYSKFRVT